MSDPVGYKTINVANELVSEVKKEGTLSLWDKRYNIYPNLYIELRSETEPKNTALTRVNSSSTNLDLLEDCELEEIEPRNREQVFALDALMDTYITTVVLTGIAGSGKTLLSIAAALHQITTKQYKKVVLTRPMSHVGKHSLGALPGDASEKFAPYLLNYVTNFEQLGYHRKSIEHMLEQYRFEVVPPQLLRGASFNNTLVIADEVQVYGNMEILTIGSRIGEGSKIVIMGDLDQRDEPIAKAKTGIHKLVNSSQARNSPLVAHVELVKCERSETARLFSEIFKEQ